MFEDVLTEFAEAISRGAAYRQLVSKSPFQFIQTAMYSRLIHKQRLGGCLCAPVASDSKKKTEIVPIDRCPGMHACESVLRGCDFQLSPSRGRISIHLFALLSKPVAEWAFT
jgi:hypothetical protein